MQHFESAEVKHFMFVTTPCDIVKHNGGSCGVLLFYGNFISRAVNFNVDVESVSVGIDQSVLARKND